MPFFVVTTESMFICKVVLYLSTFAPDTYFLSFNTKLTTGMSVAGTIGFLSADIKLSIVRESDANSRAWSLIWATELKQMQTNNAGKLINRIIGFEI